MTLKQEDQLLITQATFHCIVTYSGIFYGYPHYML